MNELTQSSKSEVALLHTIGVTAHRIEAFREAALREHGLSTAKFGVLRHLVDASAPVTLSQLADKLTCGRSNITQLVDRLEQDGLVQRVADPEDRRCLRATITEKGLERYAEGIQAELRTEEQLLQGLSPDQQRLLASLLEKFHTHM